MSHELSRRRSRAALLLAPALALALLPRLAGAPAVHAATSVVVTNCSTAGYHANGAGNIGLGTAIADALPSGSVTFACNASLGAKVGGVYLIQVPQIASPAIPIGAGTLSIDGSDGGAKDVVIDGGSGGTAAATAGVQIFHGGDGSALTLDNLTIQNGNASNGTITGSTEDGFGGAVETSGNFTANNDLFLNNQSQQSGGALELAAKSVATAPFVLDTITNSIFRGNLSGVAGFAAALASDGGAIDIDSGLGNHPNPQTVNISTSTFDSNKTTPGTGASVTGGRGAAFYSGNGVAVDTITQSLFINNVADGYGGAVHIDAGDSSTITDSQFTGNISTAAAGGAFNDNSGATNMLIRDSFINNKANNTGGGTGPGAGTGGVFYNENAASTDVIANSTMSGNSAGLNGGAISNQSGTGSLTLTADTIAGNTLLASASAKAAAGIFNTGILTIGSTIVSNNTNPAVITTNKVVNCAGVAGVLTDNGYNLEYSGVGGVDTCGFINGTNGDKTGVDPLLGPLADNGGPVAGAPGTLMPLTTMALGAGSPAIDLVTDPTVCQKIPVKDVDERSFPRYSAIRGGCDSGAFDTGGKASGAVTILGAIQFPSLPGHLGFAGIRSTAGLNATPLFSVLGYITFQDGGSSLIVRQPLYISCPNHCAAITTSTGVVPATLSLSGYVSSGRGIFTNGELVTVRFTITTTRNATTGVVTRSVTSVTVLTGGTLVSGIVVGGTPVAGATEAAPFPGLSRVTFLPS